MKQLYTLFIMLTIFIHKDGFAQGDKNFFYIGQEDFFSHNVKAYTLKSKKLYTSFDIDIRIYNYYLSPQELILFSVFQTSDKKNWIPLDSNQLQFLIDKQQLKTLYIEGIRSTGLNATNVSAVKTNTIVPVVKIDGKLCKPASLYFTEFFAVGSADLGKIFPNENLIFEIDTSSPTLSFSDFREQLHKVRNRTRLPDPAYDEESMQLNSSSKPRLFRSFTSEIEGMKAFHFWTYSNWGIVDGYNYLRGIDRLVYIPGKGIVGGAFDFFFSYKAKNGGDHRFREEYERKIVDYRISEKVLLAEELLSEQ